MSVKNPIPFWNWSDLCEIHGYSIKQLNTIHCSSPKTNNHSKRFIKDLLNYNHKDVSSWRQQQHNSLFIFVLSSESKSALRFEAFIWASSWENVSSGVSDQVRLKLACSATEASMRLEILLTETRDITLGSENKGADQTARMRRLICAFVVCIWHKTRFLMARLILFDFQAFFRMEFLKTLIPVVQTV